MLRVMYTLTYTNKFKKDLKLCGKRGRDISVFRTVVKILQETGRLPKEYKPHRLKGKYNGLWECHVGPDWLLVWDQDDTKFTLLLMHTGTHSDLF